MNPGESAAEQARKQREKAERLLRSAEMWERGAVGEQAVGAALGGLGDDWVVLHDVHWPGRRFANIDHIAVGPGGIFVIDAKNWSGTITVRGEVLRQNGYNREGAVAGCADSAIAVGELVTDQMTNVKPVLCFAGSATIEGAARDVVLCTTATLAALLVASPAVLTADKVQDIAARLRLGTRVADSSRRSPIARSGSSRRPAPARIETAIGRPRRVDSRQTAKTAACTARRRKKARGEAISALVGIVCLLVLYGTVANGHKTTPLTRGRSSGQPSSTAPHKHTGVVVYRLTASDNHGTRAVAWNEGTGGTTHSLTAPVLPLVRKYPLARVAAPLYSLNASYGGSGSITCQIVVDGVVAATRTAKGPYGYVDCVAGGNE